MIIIGPKLLFRHFLLEFILQIRDVARAPLQIVIIVLHFDWKTIRFSCAKRFTGGLFLFENVALFILRLLGASPSFKVGFCKLAGVGEIFDDHFREES